MPKRLQKVHVPSVVAIATSEAGAELKGCVDNDDEDNDLERKVDAIRKKKSRTWDDNFLVLKAYKKQHGTCNVPYKYKEDPSLSYFVQKVRAAGRRVNSPFQQGQHGKLDEHSNEVSSLGGRERLTDSLLTQNGEQADGDLARKAEKIQQKKKRTWDDNFLLLELYKQKYGDCEVPWRYKKDPALSHFVQRTRSEGRASMLEKEQREKLDKLGFRFESKQEKDERIWSEYFQQLKLFRQAHGHCYVRHKENFQLAQWASIQRSNFNLGILRRDRTAKLNSIEFVWKLLKESNKLPTLGAFPVDSNNEDDLSTREHADCDTDTRQQQRDDMEDGIQFNRRIASHVDYRDSCDKSSVESKYHDRPNKKHVYSDECEDERVTGVLDIHNKRGKRPKYDPTTSSAQCHPQNARAESYLEESSKQGPGQANLHGSSYRDKSVLTSSGAKQCTGLTPEQREKLDRIGFDWESRSERYDREWNEKLNSLKSYRLEYGDCNVPPRRDKDLNKWVSLQREYKRGGKLRLDREEKLNAIGFSWRLGTYTGDRTSGDGIWLEWFDQLKHYKQENGHTMVPKTYKDQKLARWIKTLREDYKRGVLRQDRVQMLNDIGFVWSIDSVLAAARKVEIAWEQQFDRLIAFKQNFGHVNADDGSSRGTVGAWLARQHSIAENGILEWEKLERLSKLGVTWAMKMTRGDKVGLQQVTRGDKVGLQQERVDEASSLATRPKYV